MMGLCIPVEDRHAWAFYNDEGETARVITSGTARTGMMVVTEQEDIPLMADQLVRFLAVAKKSWAVVSPDIGHHLSSYHPTPAFRMELESPAEHGHSSQPMSRANMDSAITLFSEYYDENRFKAAARARRLGRDKAYSVFLADGGFVIIRYEKEMGLLYDIYVTPSKQGEGVGDELMRCAIDEIHGRAHLAYLHTSFPRAKRLYEKYGFRPVSSHMLLRLDEIALTPPPSR
jgi:GNAT superfamily N-acetyltransferase